MRLNPSARNVLHSIAAAVSVAALSMPLAALAADIRIGGTGNALGTMRLLGDAFARLHPEFRPIVLASIGTSGAIRATARGAIDIGLSSRTLTEEETRSGLTTVEYARSPTVFAVPEKNKVTSLTLEQVADIYSGKLAKWPDGTTIRPVMRQPGDDNTTQIKRLSTDIEKAVLAADKRQGLTFAFNDQDAADRMESIPGSFGVSTIALIRSENRSLRAVALEGIEPTPENAQSGRYPMIKNFHFVLPKQTTPAVQEFIKFVKSPQGRKLLEQTGHTLP